LLKKEKKKKKILKCAVVAFKLGMNIIESQNDHH